MKIIPVKVDSNQKERMPYNDATFPVDIWTDVYDNFVDVTLNCHWHSDFEFSVLVSGKLDFYVNGIHMPMKTGDCIFINSNTMHTAQQAKDSHGTVIKGVAFPTSLFVGNASTTVYKKYFDPISTSSIQGIVIPSHTPFAGRMTSLIEEIHNLDGADFGYELDCMSVLIQLWKDTATYISESNPDLLKNKVTRKNEERAKKILTYIHENYEKELSVDDLAKQANISRSECFRCIKHFTNKNPMEYINEYRLANAARLLMESTLSITEIGLACGFNSSSYFGKMFKKAYGVSPKQYRL